VFQHQTISPAPTPEQVAQRSYTVTHEPQPNWSLRRGMDWCVRRYGHGNDWTACDGTISRHSSEERAHEFGSHWVVEGRAL
jgi:hypothetical protein